ncbi:hypothetical protein QZM64_36480, partial [Burkholderia cepacia]|nr:hypothetical protein [Burkholderia cepacia]
RLHVAVLLGSLFGRLVLETRFSRIPLANRRLQPSTTPGTLPELAREVCEYFRLKLQDADEIIADFSSIVGQWRTLATRLALPAREQERMAGAFHLASA